MLTKYTKELRSRPSLSTVEEGRPYVEKHFPALERLRTLKPGELVLEDDSGSDSDPFEDVKDGIDQGIKKAQKKLSNMERSLQIMREFSDDFKKAMEETREELKLDAHIYYEDMDQITATLSNISIPTKEISPRLQALLSSGWSLTPSPTTSPIPTETAGESQPAQPAEIPPTTATTDVTDKTSTNASSEASQPGVGGMWRQLGTTTDMIASPMYYNAHRQAAPHWLNMPSARRQTVNKAREKCKRWFRDIEGDGENAEGENN